MAQISKRVVDGKVEQVMWARLLFLLGKQHDEDKVGVILGGLLSDTERLMIAKRLMAGLLLLSGWSQVAVGETLKLSRATIGKYKMMVDLNKEYRSLLESMFPKKLVFDKQEAELTGTVGYLLKVLEQAGYLMEDVVVGYRDRSRLVYGRQR